MTPAQAPVASAPVTPAAAPAPRVALDDPEILSDPVLLKVRQAQETRRGDVRAGALARKKELAIQTGDSGLAREFGLDDTVAQLAASNPLSAFAAIKEAGRLEERDLEEGLNRANLRFSGYRGTQLGELARSILAREANAQASARQSFSGIESELLGGLSDADQREMDAEMDAYDRAVARRAAGLGGSGGVKDPSKPTDEPPEPPQNPNDPIYNPQGTNTPLRPFGPDDPYWGSGRNDLIGELLSIPARKKQAADPLIAELLRGSGGRTFAI